MINKTRLIQFDWDKYKAGLKPIYKEKEIKQLCLFDCTNFYPLIGVSGNALVSFTKDGRSNVNHEVTLFLEEVTEEDLIK